MNPRPPSAHVPELDGLRGLLASWVCVTHLLCLTGFAAVPLPHAAENLWNALIFAQPAVLVFIILSGFAITSLWEKRKPTYGEFMRGRFFRIVPVYLVCLALAFATMLLTPSLVDRARWNGSIYFTWMRALSASELGHPWLHLGAHLTLLHGVIPAAALPNSPWTILPPAWSISLEWQYYLVAPLLALLLRSWAGVATAAAVAVFGSVLWSRGENPDLAFFPAQLPLFVVGIASFHAFRACATRARGRRFVPAGIAAAVAAAVFARWHSMAITLWAVCFASALPAGSVPGAGLLSPLRKSLLHPLVQRIGKASYSLYLVHWPVLLGSLALFVRAFPAARPFQALGFMAVVALPAVGAATFLLHRYVERPAMKRGQPARLNPDAPAALVVLTSQS